VRPDEDPAAEFARATRARRRRSAGLGAATCLAGAVAFVGLATQMSDIGHAVGFAVAGLVLAGGGAVLAWVARG